MDLRGMLNDNGPSASLSKPPPPQQQQQQQQPQHPQHPQHPQQHPQQQHHAQQPSHLQQQHPPQHHPQQPHAQQHHHPQQTPQPALPSTPVQTRPQQSFRDYGPPQASPGRHISQDYGAHHHPAGPYGSPPAYQTPAAGSYKNRGPPPPPHQQHASNNDLRSPSVGSAPVPSPYRQTPSASLSNPSGYPFPPQQHPASPVQRHQYPPTNAYHRESYPQPPAPVAIPGPQPGAAYVQQGAHVPQTPPVATQTAGHPYLHRTSSAHSTPTPTSAQSQHAQYGAPFAQASPVTAPRALQQADPHPHPHPHQRQSSQPPPPGGPVPLSARPAQASSVGGGFSQPTSPYQQRVPGPGFHPAASQASPPPPPPPSLPRHPSAHSIPDSHSQDSIRAPQAPNDRDQSLSVSPKTRVPSLPSSSGRPSTSVSELDPYLNHSHSAAPTMAERAATPAKRKLEDRELPPDELEKRDPRPPPFEDSDGRPPAFADAGPPAHRPAAPVMPAPAPKRRKVHRTTPPWAQSARDRAPAHPNRILYHPVPHDGGGGGGASAGTGSQPNGKVDRPAPPTRMQSRHASPDDKRAAAPITPAPSLPPDAGSQWGPLGPWEASITNSVPQEQISKAVADFLFQYVVMNEDLGEIQSRGVKFEIEAKFGMLIDKGTNQRVDLPVNSECVLNEGRNWLGFRSSMTELQHKSFNDFLNHLVQQTHPANKAAHAALPRPRLPIDYRHRHEIDRFFELPAAVRDRSLPVCVAKPIAAKGHGVKVRVTYDQKSNKVLGKIVKARIADLSLHFPHLPLDCRISVNLEMDWEGTVEDLERMASSTGRASPPARTKDRLSYKHGCYQIDLTQVTQSVTGLTNTQRIEKEHELEVEIDPGPVIEQGRRAMEGQPHQYVEVVDGLINNIRILARKAADFGG